MQLRIFKNEQLNVTADQLNNEDEHLTPILLPTTSPIQLNTVFISLRSKLIQAID